MSPAASATAAILLASLAACSSGNTARDPAQAPVPVTLGVVQAKDVPVTVQVIGSVEAYSTVEVRSQVGGELLRVPFSEGQDVHRGDVLFVIDPRPFEAALQQAKAQLERDRAQLKNARADADRYAGLVEKDYITPSEFDKIKTTASALEATVQSDEAAVKSAELQLEYSTLRSPIAGRTGRLMVHPGNVVKANSDAPLVVIEQMDPIYVSFSVPEQRLLEIKRLQAAGTLAVEALVPDSGGRSASGRLSFIDNSVDHQTGTVLLKGTFSNPERILWPGQFVTATLTLSTRAGALVVPSEAVQTGQQGSFVFVVKPDSTVESRPVTVGVTTEHESVIEKGLAAGEQVVTDGQLRLVPGAKVVAKTGGGAGGGGEGKGADSKGGGTRAGDSPDAGKPAKGEEKKP
jgi:multidrug efflux system membrane fusion protein